MGHLFVPWKWIVFHIVSISNCVHFSPPYKNLLWWSVGNVSRWFAAASTVARLVHALNPVWFPVVFKPKSFLAAVPFYGLLNLFSLLLQFLPCLKFVTCKVLHKRCWKGLCTGSWATSMRYQMLVILPFPPFPILNRKKEKNVGNTLSLIWNIIQ
jgi:hypothetical protein